MEERSVFEVPGVVSVILEACGSMYGVARVAAVSKAFAEGAKAKRRLRPEWYGRLEVVGSFGSASEEAQPLRKTMKPHFAKVPGGGAEDAAGPRGLASHGEKLIVGDLRGLSVFEHETFVTRVRWEPIVSMSIFENWLFAAGDRGALYKFSLFDFRLITEQNVIILPDGTEISRVQALCTSTTGRLFASCLHEDTSYVAYADAKTLRWAGCLEEDEDFFQSAPGLAAHESDIFACDGAANTISVWNASTTKEIRSFPAFRTKRSLAARNNGLTWYLNAAVGLLDDLPRLFISEFYGSRVYVMSLHGAPLFSCDLPKTGLWAGAGRGQLQIHNDTLYVTDSETNKVHTIALRHSSNTDDALLVSATT